MKRFLSNRVMLTALLLMGGLFLLSACMPDGVRYTKDSPAGFFWGIWHGWIAPLSLIFGFFNDSIRIYEANNTGWWYDFGFYMAVIAGFGGISLIRRSGSDD